MSTLKGSGQKILLVEDETGARNFAARILRENDYVVFETGSAGEAKDIFNREQDNFHLVFSDKEKR